VATAVDELHKDHANVARLLELLNRELKVFESGGRPDFAMMREIMRYMTQYPDAFHHPKEDLVFDKLAERAQSAIPDLENLAREHKALRTRGEELVGLLAKLDEADLPAYERIEIKTKEYSLFLETHMRKEEHEIFPLSKSLLIKRDWTDIETGIHQRLDPLFGSVIEKGYQTLRQALLERKPRSS